METRAQASSSTLKAKRRAEAAARKSMARESRAKPFKARPVPKSTTAPMFHRLMAEREAKSKLKVAERIEVRQACTRHETHLGQAQG